MPNDAVIVGAYELPLRAAPDISLMDLHAAAARGALADAGLSLRDVDGFFCAGDVPGFGALSLVDYLNLDLSYSDTSELGGASYVAHVMHAAAAIARGHCKVALITLAGRPRSEGINAGTMARPVDPRLPEQPYEIPFKPTNVNMYGLAAARHMYEFGTTLEQLAWVKVSASHHAQHNPQARINRRIEIDEVMASPVLSNPLRRHDCCVVTDGGGAIVMVAPEIAATLDRPKIRIKGGGETIGHLNGGYPDLVRTAAAKSGSEAFRRAGVTIKDVKYASIYDSFTITVLLLLEDLGFCERGKSGAYVQDGNLIAGIGRIPVNTDGGGMCSNHPGNRGGMTKIIEAVRQLRGEAHPALQVRSCDLALVQGIGGSLGSRYGSATVILERI